MTMRFATGAISDVDHDQAMAWIDHMKGVYQTVIDRHSQSGEWVAGDIVKARNHLRSLAIIEKALRQHHEIAQGRDYPGGPTRPVRYRMDTVATLILPDGTRREIGRHE